MRLVICGGRNLNDAKLVDAALNAVQRKVGIDVVISEAARIGSSRRTLKTE